MLTIFFTRKEAKPILQATVLGEAQLYGEVRGWKKREDTLRSGFTSDYTLAKKWRNMEVGTVGTRLTR